MLKNVYTSRYILKNKIIRSKCFTYFYANELYIYFYDLKTFMQLFLTKYYYGQIAINFITTIDVNRF